MKDARPPDCYAHMAEFIKQNVVVTSRDGTVYQGYMEGFDTFGNVLLSDSAKVVNADGRHVFTESNGIMLLRGDAIILLASLDDSQNRQKHNVKGSSKISDNMDEVNTYLQDLSGLGNTPKSVPNPQTVVRCLNYFPVWGEKDFEIKRLIDEHIDSYQDARVALPIPSNQGVSVDVMRVNTGEGYNLEDNAEDEVIHRFATIAKRMFSIEVEESLTKINPTTTEKLQSIFDYIEFRDYIKCYVKNCFVASDAEINEKLIKILESERLSWLHNLDAIGFHQIKKSLKLTLERAGLLLRKHTPYTQYSCNLRIADAV